MSGCKAYRLATAHAGAVAFTLLTLLCVAPAQADCEQNGAMNASDDAAAPIPFGRVNLASTRLQPAGSLLASTVVPPTAYTANGIAASTVLWICDTTDLPNLRFLVSTNGDSRYGGHNDIGTPDGLSHVYATVFNHVGLRLTMDGVALTRYWQAVPLRHYVKLPAADDGRTRIGIRLQDIPMLHAELYRVSTLTPNQGGFDCGLGEGLAPSAEGTPYQCNQPNAYIQLAGFGDGSKHDTEGEDHNENYRFWWTNNGFGYGMNQASTLTSQASCAVRHHTPHVVFPPISATHLRAGGEVSAHIDMQIECDHHAGASPGRPAIGIQVSPGAWRAAQTLNLVNPAGGVSMLVSDNYEDDATLAAGVGIVLKSADAGLAQHAGQPLYFAGQAPPPDAIPNPEAAGWYPVLEAARQARPFDTRAPVTYHRRYTATLRALSGQTVTAGRVQATAYVVVKVQ